MRQYVSLEGARILDVGCGLGLYVRRFRDFSGDVHGVDIDPAKVREAGATLPNIRQASAEQLPYPDETFDVLLSHEVLEHVSDDRAAVREAHRVLKPGGRLIVFVPNRLYPFETHGIYWRGKYHYGNIPLVNYLPDGLRARLCPHVRAYTSGGLRRLFERLPGRIVVHRYLFAGYDNIVARWPALGRLLRRVTHALEDTPLRIFGLSHFVVYERS
jgi:SAM-dependent methyltransferase